MQIIVFSPKGINHMPKESNVLRVYLRVCRDQVEVQASSIKSNIYK